MTKRSKYEPLATFLAGQPASEKEVTLSFRQIEELLGANLPDSAFVHREWWGNQADNLTRPQARAWMQAGFVVDMVSQSRSNRSVRFRRKYHFEDLHGAQEVSRT